MEIKEQLAFICTKLRSSPLPIADIIPTLQKAKDRIQELEAIIDKLKSKNQKPLPALFKPLIKKEQTLVCSTTQRN